MAYIAETWMAGSVDLSLVVPSNNATSGALGIPWTSGSANALPSATQENQLGQIVQAWDSSTTAQGATGQGGFGEFIWLAVPVSTAITAGLLYYFTPSDYKVVIVPATVSTTVSGAPICVAVNAVTSQAGYTQFTWFQITGRCTALKTAVQVLPNVPLYVSGTAGRVKVLLSTFRSILGARSANATTITTTTSTVAVYLSRPVIQASQ